MKLLLNQYYRYLITLLLLLSAATSLSAGGLQFQIQLQSLDGKQSIPVGVLQMTPNDAGWDYQLKMQEAAFGDYFLSMRPFKCMTDSVDMLCHLPYPYQVNRQIDKKDLTDLEYELLFIRRKPTDYGINPWNGLYYQIRWQNGQLIGEAYEVDLDLLAVPPEDNNLRPIRKHDLHEIDGAQLWLPRLVAMPLN